VQIPPVQQLLPGLLGELPFLPPLAELLAEAAHVAAVLPQQLVLQLLVLRAGVDLLRAARVQVILGRPSTFAIIVCTRQEKMLVPSIFP
jgi:hypothetical protein